MSPWPDFSFQVATYALTWTCLIAYLSGVVVSEITRKMLQSLFSDVCRQDSWVSVLEWSHSLSWLLLPKTGSSGYARMLPRVFLQVLYFVNSKGIYYVTIRSRALGWFAKVNKVWSLSRGRWSSDGARSGLVRPTGQLLAQGWEGNPGVAENIEANQSPRCSVLCRSRSIPATQSQQQPVLFNHLTHVSWSLTLCKAPC